MRLEYYTPLKKSFILQSKGAHFEKFAAALRAAKLVFISFSSASRGTSWPLHFKFASYAYVVVIVWL